MSKPARLNAANLLTLFRIMTVPVVVLLLLTPDDKEISFDRSIIAFSLFTVASITDLFDGWVARHYQMVTALGKLLDPLADKLLVCCAMVMLIPPGRVQAWVVAIIVAREIGVTALRGVATTEGLVIAASPLGKAKSLLLTLGVGALTLHYPIFGLDTVWNPTLAEWGRGFDQVGLPATNFVELFGMTFLMAGLVMTAWSGIDYFLRFVGEIFKK
ncbi:MAG TPA: CDP-diacylglycerol--glycerol-3-phosphate 3-phosphatidyltransferase [Candidatus Deferrimicrobiaceae bacterium]|jgi:CDP-diacylglycerol--glycerol-3-phosphate 3-phosphatidyltransferase